MTTIELFQSLKCRGRNLVSQEYVLVCSVIAFGPLGLWEET